MSLTNLFTDVVIGFTDVQSEVNETEGCAEVCIGIVTGTLERNVTVYLKTIPVTGKDIILSF